MDRERQTATTRRTESILAATVFAILMHAGHADAASAPVAPPFDAPLAIAPLDTPLVVTGGFGEYRIGHFHAGFDFGTHKKVGAPVRAPLPGHVERVRASGVGYGRSVYVRTTDGRLLQFGHLDAYSGPLAAWVDSIQRATGQYEQDLWPEASRFRVKTGQRIAWTGESGAGGPHMHFEIRRGDVAFHPERAGLRIKDRQPPAIVSVTLEPLDDQSFVDGSAAPRTCSFGARPETLRVVGRVRAVVGARDGVWSGVDRMVPWSTRIEWDDQWVECRMDSISWADEMNQSVYDAGRVVGDQGIVLWAPANWRPRFILSSAPRDREAGTIVVRAGDAPRTVRFLARDVTGNQVEWRVVLVAGSAPAGKSAAPAGGRSVALPGGFVRTEGAGRAVVEPPTARSTPARSADLEWDAPTSFDGAAVWSRPFTLGPAPDLIPVRSLSWIGPASTPLVKAFPLRIANRDIADTAHVGLYRRTASDWDYVRMTRRADGHGWDAESSRLGEFALFADTLAPRITPQKPPHKVTTGPYPRWAVEATIAEAGSGLDARASYLTVDGQRVPTEWDPEASVLRWRPLQRPKKGTHQVSILASDRAGNSRVRSLTFVLD
jgi:hypothetical protein